MDGSIVTLSFIHPSQTFANFVNLSKKGMDRKGREKGIGTRNEENKREKKILEKNVEKRIEIR